MHMHMHMYIHVYETFSFVSKAPVGSGFGRTYKHHEGLQVDMNRPVGNCCQTKTIYQGSKRQIAIDLHRFSDGFILELDRFPYGFKPVFLWIYVGFPMDLHCFCYGFIKVFKHVWLTRLVKP